MHKNLLKICTNFSVFTNKFYHQLANSNKNTTHFGLNFVWLHNTNTHLLYRTHVLIIEYMFGWTLVRQEIGCHFWKNLHVYAYALIARALFLPSYRKYFNVCKKTHGTTQRPLVYAPSSLLPHRLTRPLHGAEVPLTRFVPHNLYKK